MKRKDLIRHLLDNGCILEREGARHSVFLNTSIGKSSTVLRHSEIDNWLSKKICKDLGIKTPIKK